MCRTSMTIEVAVQEVLWASPGSTVFSSLAADGRKLLVRMDAPINPVKGEVYAIEGRESDWLDKWGRTHRQVNASSCHRVRTSGALLGPWLRSLPGIGEDRATRLLLRFGGEIMAALSDPALADQLAEALAPARPHLGQKLAALVQARFAARRATEAAGLSEAGFYRKLEEIGVIDRQAARSLFRLLGSLEPWDRLLAHPYSVAAVMEWKNADHVGQRLLLMRDDIADVRRHPARLLGACDAAWRRILASGDTASTAARFAAELARLGVNADAAIALGLRSQRLLATGGLYRAPGASRMERDVALELKRLSHAVKPFDWDRLVRQGETKGRSLTAQQRAAVIEVLGRPVSLLQGGAGTGKTTTVRVLVDAWIAGGGNVVLAALAGKAALRLSRSTGRVALTLARLVHGLERRAEAIADGKSVDEGIPTLDGGTLVVVDESSMVDLVSWRRLLRLLPVGSRLCMVGDVAQLPPVGLGRIYHDLVEDGRWVSVLTRNLRQASDNPLVKAASEVRDGVAPDLPPYAGVARGISLMECPTDGHELALQRVRNDFEEASTPSDQMLVLAALNRTCRRFCSLMQVRQENEGRPGIRLGPLAPFVSVGDPVVATRNRYEKALMNGLIGWLATTDGPSFQFDGEETPREVGPEAGSELASAWAITGHRAQGSEAMRVAVALDGKDLLTREWLYTAITRATEQVVLVGSREALQSAVQRRTTRCTAFKQEMAMTSEHLK